MQQAWAGTGAEARLITVPDPSDEVVPGVPWGSIYGTNTPAYWTVRCGWAGDVSIFSGEGSTLAEEVGFCLLGGFGVRYEVAAAAFDRLRHHGVFALDSGVGEAEIRDLLLVPLDIHGRRQRYRFSNQRASRLAAARRRLASTGFDALSALDLREALMGLDGIGPKTASWIVRNHLDSDDVAIIDVHVIRACRGMGLFVGAPSLPRDYGRLEARFLSLARAIDVRASVLDAVMWTEARSWRPH